MWLYEQRRDEAIFVFVTLLLVHLIQNEIVYDLINKLNGYFFVSSFVTVFCFFKINFKDFSRIYQHPNIKKLNPY